jgi:hypothetical protein
MRKRGIFAKNFKVDDGFIETYLTRMASKKYPKDHKEAKVYGNNIRALARKMLESKNEETLAPAGNISTAVE